MSVKVMGIVWEADLPQREKFVLLAYADHADHEGYNVYPSVGLIAWKTGYSARSIQRITKTLINDGILIEDGMSQYSTKRYRINIDAIPRLTQYKGGVKVSPGVYGGDILSGVGVTNCQGGDTSVTGGVTKTALRGDTAMSPDPSLTVIKPSVVLSPTAILCKASNLSSFPADQIEWAEVIRSLVEDHGEERTIEALTSACNRWASTKNKNGKYYKKTDLRWINWAQEELAGAPEAAIPDINTDPKAYAEYLAQKYEGA